MARGCEGERESGTRRDHGRILKDTSNTKSRHSKASHRCGKHPEYTFNIHVDVIITGVFKVRGWIQFKFRISADCIYLYTRMIITCPNDRESNLNLNDIADFRESYDGKNYNYN